jgi:hypothetical protein
MKINQLCPGDVLLFRPSSFLGRIVAWAIRSEYCHAAMYTIDKGVAEFREFFGYRILPPEDHSKESIDVFRADIPKHLQYNATRSFKALLSEPYSFWHGIEAFLLRRLPRFLRKKECDHHGYHCSQAVSKAYREAGYDLRPDLADWMTTPGDHAKSKRLHCLGTLEF